MGWSGVKLKGWGGMWWGGMGWGGEACERKNVYRVFPFLISGTFIYITTLKADLAHANPIDH